MPVWTIPLMWKGEDAIVIGGGSSLRGFDFQGLRGRNTIGVNDAFRLGPEICRLCVFGDSSWFHKVKWDLEQYALKGGTVVTCAPSLGTLQAVPWLRYVHRSREGLEPPGGNTIAWNWSSGAAAINVALALGATRVLLLGFDASANPVSGRTHWHDQPRSMTSPDVYARFIRGFEKIHAALPRAYPGARIFNVTDGSSKVPFFPRMTFEQFWAYVPLRQRAPCVSCQKRAEDAARRFAEVRA